MPDPYDLSAQIDLIGMPRLMIHEDPTAVPNGGSASGVVISEDVG